MNMSSSDFKKTLARKILMFVADRAPEVRESNERVAELESRLAEADQVVEALKTQLSHTDDALESRLRAQEDMIRRGQVVREAYLALELKEQQRAELEQKVDLLNKLHIDQEQRLERTKQSLATSKKMLSNADIKVLHAETLAAEAIDNKATLLNERTQFLKEKNEAVALALKAEAKSEQLTTQLVMFKTITSAAETERRAAVMAREKSQLKMEKLERELQKLQENSAKPQAQAQAQGMKVSGSGPLKVSKLPESYQASLPVLSKMAQDELEEECTMRGLPLGGALPELRVRLRIARKVEENARSRP